MVQPLAIRQIQIIYTHRDSQRLDNFVYLLLDHRQINSREFVTVEALLALATLERCLTTVVPLGSCQLHNSLSIAILQTKPIPLITLQNFPAHRWPTIADTFPKGGTR